MRGYRQCHHQLEQKPETQNIRKFLCDMEVRQDKPSMACESVTGMALHFVMCLVSCDVSGELWCVLWAVMCQVSCDVSGKLWCVRWAVMCEVSCDVSGDVVVVDMSSLCYRQSWLSPAVQRDSGVTPHIQLTTDCSVDLGLARDTSTKSESLNFERWVLCKNNLLVTVNKSSGELLQSHKLKSWIVFCK